MAVRELDATLVTDGNSLAKVFVIDLEIVLRYIFGMIDFFRPISFSSFFHLLIELLVNLVARINR